MDFKEQNHKPHYLLNEFITALTTENKTKYSEIVRSMKIPASAFEPYCSWSEESYTRNCIIENEKFELILLCWDAGQKTPIHDHGGEECWVKMIQGEIKETIFQVSKSGELNTIKSSIAIAGDMSYMVDFMGYHRLENLSQERGMSLHLYAKPIRNCNLFDEDSKTTVRKEMVYHTMSELMVY